MFDAIIAFAIGGVAALTVYGICCLLDAFISMQTGEDVALEDVPPTLTLPFSGWPQASPMRRVVRRFGEQIWMKMH